MNFLFVKVFCSPPSLALLCLCVLPPLLSGMGPVGEAGGGSLGDLPVIQAKVPCWLSAGTTPSPPCFHGSAP